MKRMTTDRALAQRLIFHSLIRGWLRLCAGAGLRAAACAHPAQGRWRQARLAEGFGTNVLGRPSRIHSEFFRDIYDHI